MLRNCRVQIDMFGFDGTDYGQTQLVQKIVLALIRFESAQGGAAAVSSATCSEHQFRTQESQRARRFLRVFGAVEAPHSTRWLIESPQCSVTCDGESYNSRAFNLSNPSAV